MQNIFHIRIGGEYGKTRRDMLELAVIHARKLGWRGYKDEGGMYVNAFYFDDAKAGAFSALEGGFRTVLLDRPDIQEAHMRIFDPAVLNDTVVEEVLDRFGPDNTRRIIIGEPGVTTQSLFTTATLDNYWLLRPAEHTHVKFHGWLQPAMHALWQVHEDEPREVAFRGKEM